MKRYVIMLAGGRGTRMNLPYNKALLTLCGKTVIQRSIEAFCSFADEMIIVSHAEEQAFIQESISHSCLPFPCRYVCGGETRQESVLNGLKALNTAPEDIILIHDAARCLVDHMLIERVIHSVETYGTGIPGIPASSTYKICNADHLVVHTPDRTNLYEIQTPQGFTAGTFLPVALNAFRDGIVCTDDAGLLEHYHIPVKVVQGSPDNIKLTEPQDIARAKSIIKGVTHTMRVGMGFDVHRLVEGRKLILCGVEIPFESGLLGHSDADVALHALMDAMLGACALGDIGRHFPDTDDRYKGISSVHLLRETDRIIHDAGYKVENADVTIVAQKPKLLPFIPQMISVIASVLNLPEDRINVKATTTEKLGFEGRMEGISSYAVCTVAEI